MGGECGGIGTLQCRMKNVWLFLIHPLVLRSDGVTSLIRRGLVSSVGGCAARS